MEIFPKIQTIFKRNPDNNFKTLLLNEFSKPEFEYLKDNKWIWTEKVDGTNIRIIWKDNHFIFKGRTDKSNIPTKLLNNLYNMIMPKTSKFLDLFDSKEICLYGEGYGQGIRSGGLYSKDQKFVLFAIKVSDCWLSREKIEDIAKYIGIDIVPVIGEGTISQMVDFVRNGFSSAWGDFQSEGIIAQPKVPLFFSNGTRIITKLKYRDFHRD